MLYTVDRRSKASDRLVWGLVLLSFAKCMYFYALQLQGRGCVNASGCHLDLSMLYFIYVYSHVKYLHYYLLQ